MLSNTAERTSTIKEIGDEPLPGYRLLQPLGEGGFGEVWKCEAPGGLLKAIKFVKGSDHGGTILHGGQRDSAAVEFQAIQRVKDVRHPFLLSLERVEVLAGELVLVMELADHNLADRFDECQAAGQPGIDRDELLAYLTEAAEALDVLNLKHGLQHLDVKPANLFIIGNHIKVADFGLVNSLEEMIADGPPKDLGGLTPNFVAPEMLRGKISRHCDQYSLAVVYQALLTGVQPFTGANPRQVMLAHLTGEPNLSPLPEGDRAAVARALSKDSADRFPSCLHFVQALVFGEEEAAPESKPAPRPKPRRQPLSAQGLILPSQHTTVVTRRPKLPPNPIWPEPAEPLTPSTSETPAEQDPANASPAAETPASAAPESKPSSNTSLTLPGCYLLLQLSSGPFGELYRARDTSGRERQVRYLPVDADLDYRLLNRLAALDHTTLPRLEVERIVNGRVALLSDAHERTLEDRYKECVAAGSKGIPRAELLRALGIVAETLDRVRRREHLQHLALSPQTLLLSGDRVQLGDFGLAQLLWLPRWRKVAHPHSRYAAPELLKGCPNPSCDAYSLALIYAEMLTGFHPFRNRLRSRAAAAGAPANPDLDWLPAADQDAIAQALDPEPRERFQNCTGLFEALTNASRSAAVEQVHIDALQFIQPFENLFGAMTQLADPPSINRIVTQLVLTESAAVTIGIAEKLPYLQHADNVLESRFPIRQLPGMTRLKMASFCEKWQAQLVAQTDHSFVMQLQQSGNFWQRCFGQKAGLEVRLDLRAPSNSRDHTSEAVATVRTFGGVENLTAGKFQDVGPMLLVSLRDDLQNTPDQRGQIRWPCSPAMDVYPILPNGRVGPVLEAKGIDISFGGIAFWTATRPASSQLAYLHLKTFAELADCVFLVRVTRVGPCDGGYKSGAAFAIGGGVGLESPFA